MTSLILFDLDGTLVDVFEYHISSYLDMFKEVYGVEIEESNLTKNFGLPEPDVIGNPLREKAIEEQVIQKNLKKATECYFSNLGKKIPKGDKAILPGVLPLLEELSKENYVMGLITGNVPEVGEMILKKTGLEKYFPIKVFTDESIEKREDIVNKAIEDAKKNYGLKEEIVIIVGDSLHDLKAANNTGCIGIGVATAFTEKEELEKESEYVLDDLKNTNDILTLIKKIQKL